MTWTLRTPRKLPDGRYLSSAYEGGILRWQRVYTDRATAIKQQGDHMWLAYERTRKREFTELDLAEVRKIDRSFRYGKV